MQRTRIRQFWNRVFGLMLFPWPLVAYASVFLLDAPHSGLTELFLGYVVLSTFFYPFYVWAGRSLSRKAHEMNGNSAEILACALLPALSGLPWMTIAAILLIPIALMARFFGILDF